MKSTSPGSEEKELAGAKSFMERLFFEERCWRPFNEQSKLDLNLDNRIKLKQVMQGWCTCVFQTSFTLFISLLFIESRTKFADDYHMTLRFSQMEQETESQVVDPATFFEYVHAMERGMLKTTYSETTRTDRCSVLFGELCEWGTNKGLNDSIVDDIIAEGCWNLTEHNGFIDSNNRLLFATHLTQTRRKQIECANAIDIVDPYPATRECLSETEEDNKFIVTTGPCLGNLQTGSLDDCFRFGGWSFNTLANGYAVSFSEPSYGFPGYSECRINEINRLAWADRRTKQLCYLFHVLNRNNNKILRFSNCFTFGLGGEVTKVKVISIVNIVSEEYYHYAYGMCVLAIFLAVFRASCETLFFFKELYFGPESRNREMFVGVLRDLTTTDVQFAINRYRCFSEGMLIWLSSSLFIVYFSQHMSFLDAMYKVHLLPEGVYVLNAYEAFNWNIYFGIFDNLSKIEARAEINAGLALVAFLVNTFAYIFAMNFHPRLGVVNSILGQAFSDLIAFALVICIFVALTAMMGYTVFGRSWEEFASYPMALQTVASAAVGDYERLYDLDPIVPQFMVTLFFVFVWFIRLLGTVLLINILISIFAKSYEDRKDSQSLNTVRLFWSCIVAAYFWLFSCCFSSRTSRAMWRQAISANERKRRESLTRAKLGGLGGGRNAKLQAMRFNFPSAHSNGSGGAGNRSFRFTMGSRASLRSAASKTSFASSGRGPQENDDEEEQREQVQVV